MEISPAAKVGMITVLAAIILALIYTSVSGSKRLEGVKYYAMFDRVEGLTVGAAVRLAGVTIGKVTDININEAKQVVVEFTVTYQQNGDPIKISANSRFGITSNLLGDKWFEITPRAGPPLNKGGQVVGTPPATIDQLMGKGEEALGELESSVKDFNKLVGDPEFKRNITETVANFNALSGDMRTAAGNVNTVLTNLNARMTTITGHVDSLVTGLQGDLHAVGADFRGLSGAMRRVGERSEPEVHTIVANLRDMSASLKTTMSTVQTLAQNKDLRADLLGTASALHRASEEVASVAGDIHGITSDPQIKQDLEATIHEARQTMEGANKLIKSVQKAVGGFTGGGEGGFHLFDFRTEAEYAFDSQHLYPNASLTVFPTFPYNAVLGVDSVGYKNLFNAQLGMGQASRLRARFGVVRSKLGAGFDTQLFHRLGLSADVYDTKNVKVDVLGRMTVGNGFYLMGGVREAFRKSNAPVVGVGKRF